MVVSDQATRPSLLRRRAPELLKKRHQVLFLSTRIKAVSEPPHVPFRDVVGPLGHPAILLGELRGGGLEEGDTRCCHDVFWTGANEERPSLLQEGLITFVPVKDGNAPLMLRPRVSHYFGIAIVALIWKYLETFKNTWNGQKKIALPQGRALEQCKKLIKRPKWSSAPDMRISLGAYNKMGVGARTQMSAVGLADSLWLPPPPPNNIAWDQSKSFMGVLGGALDPPNPSTNGPPGGV